MMNEKIARRISIKKVGQDTIVIVFFCILSALVGYAFPSSNIGFFIGLIPVLYVLIKGNKNTTLVFAMMIVLAYDYFGLVPWLSIGAGTLHWYDINVVFSLMLLLKTAKARKKSKYSIIIYIYFVFILLACYQSWRLYGQDILTTLLSARSSLVLIGYGSLVYLIKNDRIDRSNALQLFEKISKIAILCYWIQFVFVNIGIDITYLPTKYRWGTRVYINFLFILFYFLYHLYFVLYKKEERKNHIIQCILCVLTIAVVSQSRSILFYMAITTLIMVIISLRVNKIVLYSILLIAVIAVFLAIPFTRNVIISSALESTSDDTGSIAYRSLETQYYEEQLKGNELFGVGIPNKHDVDALDYSGRKSELVDVRHRSFNLTDLGAFKIRYQFGIVGYILYFTMLIILIVQNIKFKGRAAPSFAAFAMVVFLLIDSSMIEIFTRVPFLMMLVLMFLEIDFTVQKDQSNTLR